MSSNQHSGADVLTALFSDVQPSLGTDAVVAGSDHLAQCSQQFRDGTGEGGRVSADDALARLLSATNAALWQVLGGGDGPLGRKREPVIGEGQ